MGELKRIHKHNESTQRNGLVNTWGHCGEWVATKCNGAVKMGRFGQKITMSSNDFYLTIVTTADTFAFQHKHAKCNTATDVQNGGTYFYTAGTK